MEKKAGWAEDINHHAPYCFSSPNPDRLCPSKVILQRSPIGDVGISHLGVVVETCGQISAIVAS